MLRRVLRSVPIDLLDKRSAIGVAARKRREELIDHCGGAEAVSPAQVILIDTAVKTELIVRAAGLSEADCMAVGGWKTRAVFDWYNLGDVEALRERLAAAQSVGRKVVPLRRQGSGS